MDDFKGSFGKGMLSVIWEDQGLRDGLTGGPARIERNLEAILQRYAPEVENWMKTNASWKDQTGAARNGLAARFYSDQSSKGIVLFHQVPYGIWLEVRYSGQYGIIIPALETWGPVVMQGTRDMLRDMGRNG